MTDEKATGGPAFPVGAEFFSDGSMAHPAQWGMTLRDYIATKAMQGMLAATPHDYAFDSESVTEAAYEIADAMLKARQS